MAYRGLMVTSHPAHLSSAFGVRGTGSLLLRACVLSGLVACSAA